MEKTMKKDLMLMILGISLFLNVYAVFTIKQIKNISSEQNIVTIEEMTSVPDTLSEWNTLQLAIAMTESEFNPRAVGKTKDYGIYQITPIYVAEVNRLLGKNVYTHDQAFDINKSVEMFNILQAHKNPNQDIDKAIYYHNRASWYKKRVLHNYDTVKRYETLRSVLKDKS